MAFHIEMPFNDAVAQAEKLGGVCQLSTSRRNDGAIYAHCEYESCDNENPTNECGKQNLESSGVSIASQPIIRVGFEALDASSKLTQIAISFEGSSEVVQERLAEQFGEPSRDGSAASEKSWSNARRLHWTQGNHHLGLHTTLKIIMLTTNPRVPESDPGTT